MKLFLIFFVKLKVFPGDHFARLDPLLTSIDRPSTKECVDLTENVPSTSDRLVSSLEELGVAPDERTAADGNIVLDEERFVNFSIRINVIFYSWILIET